MATSVYNSGYIELIDGTEIYITPLKIKYLREFMDAFETIKLADNDDEALIYLVNCVRIAMQQYYPELRSNYQIEDSMDIVNMYKLLEFAADIKMDRKEEDIADNAKNSKGNSWADMDLAKLESEAFLLGIWKDYEELELSISMQELVAILDAKREKEYSDRKFFAAIQGVDLDKQTGRDEPDPWEAMKARVFSGGKTSDPNDIVSFQGTKAANAGFGIGMGIGYQRIG